MTQYLGDFPIGSTLYFKFTTHKADGTPIVLTGTPTIDIFRDDGVDHVQTGVTLTASFHSIVGLNHVKVVCTDGFYTAGEYQAVITAGTVDSISVVGYVVASWSIEKRVGNLTKIMGTALTETSTGYLKAGFVKLFDVVTPTLTADAAGMAAIADALLDRDMSVGTDTAYRRSPRNALRFLRNKWSLSGTTLTITKENDSTTAWTSEVITDAEAAGITSSNPVE